MSLPVRKLQTLCQVSCISNYLSVKGEFCVYLMRQYPMAVNCSCCLEGLEEGFL